MDVDKIIDRLDFRKLCERFGIADQRGLNKFYQSVIEIEKSNKFLLQEIERLKGEGWISVDDRLPEDINKAVLTIDDCEECEVLNYNTYRKHWFNNLGIDYDYENNITHWQPLPKASEELE